MELRSLKCAKCGRIYVLGANAAALMATSAAASAAASYGTEADWAKMKAHADVLTCTEPEDGSCSWYNFASEDLKYLDELQAELKFVTIRYWRCSKCAHVQSYNTELVDSFKVSAASLDEARAKAESLIGKANVTLILRDRVSASHRQARTSETLQGAQELAAAAAPAGVAIGVHAPLSDKQVLFARDAKLAREEWAFNNADAASRPNIQVEIETVAPSKRGILGIGAKPGEYRIAWNAPAYVEIEYPGNAEITVFHTELSSEALTRLFTHLYDGRNAELSSDAVRKILSDLLPARNRSPSDDFAKILKMLQHCDIRTELELWMLIKKNLRQILQKDWKRAYSEKTTHFFAHHGLTRIALDVTLGEARVRDWDSESKS